MKNKNKDKTSNILFSFCIMVIFLGSIYVLEATNTTHLFRKAPTVRAPGKPVTSLPGKPITDNGDKALTQNTSTQEGTGVDKNGQTPTSKVPTDPSNWSTSENGLITLKLPGNNAILKSGFVIYGSAKVNPVEYRLIDDAVGVISQGPINVLGGNFSASITFTAHTNSGRLDIFNTQSNGKEINELQIPVRFTR